MMPALNGIVLTVGSSLAGSIIAKVTPVMGLGLIAVWFARDSRAAIRHALLAATFGATLLLPIAAMLMPAVRLGVPIEAESRAAMLPLVMDVDTNPSATAVGAGARGAAVAPEGPRLSLANLLLAGWGVGVALFLFPAFVGLWQSRSLRRSGLPWRYGQSLVDRLALDAGIRRPVEVLLHEALPGPMTCGVARPAILLPQDAETWNPEDLSRAMIHELEHVRRGDSVWLCLARAACAVYWFHPLVWIARRKLVLEAERSCDDAVLGYSEATAYADQLVSLARRLSMARRSPVLAMANCFDLAARVDAVLDSRQKRGRAGAGALILVCTVLFLLLIAMSPVTLVAAPQAASGKVQFEVASIRPMTPDFGAGAAATAGVRVDGAQFHASMPLRGFVALAYKAHPHQFEAPEWMSSQWYEIAATLPDGHTKTGEVLEMLQALLVERFHMKIHKETKELPILCANAYEQRYRRKGRPARSDRAFCGSGEHILGDEYCVQAAAWRDTGGWRRQD